MLSNDEIDDSFWPTPAGAMVPKFLTHVWKLRYAEPCAGNGKLIRHLADNSQCVWASDIRPRHPSVRDYSVFELTKDDLRYAQCVITNPPFSSNFVYPLIDHILHLDKPLWLLLPADFMHRRTSAFVMAFCERIVSIGPIKFIDDSVSEGEHQFAWFKFTPERQKTVFEARDATFNSSKVPQRMKDRYRAGLRKQV